MAIDGIRRMCSMSRRVQIDAICGREVMNGSVSGFHCKVGDEESDYPNKTGIESLHEDLVSREAGVLVNVTETVRSKL